MSKKPTEQKNKIDAHFAKEALEDFHTACLSREASLIGRKEVLTGKAKFGIFGDGKEVAQTAMARVFQAGDFRSGYYRDQTFMFASGLATVQQFFAQLYAHPDPEHDPFSAGRQMNAHFATPLIDAQGNWLPQKDMKNVSADISPTAGQVARSLGLALASKKYRQSEALQSGTPFSEKGDEVSFVTIGDASTSEGVFWETVNAAGVMQVPLAIMVWDDGYGISVPIEYQTTKGSISEVLKGFQPTKDKAGVRIHTVKAWDYQSLRDVFEKAIRQTRKQHEPCLIHVQEVTQPQGHSTSGSHERYKSKARLEWEKEMDGIAQMKSWMVKEGLASEEELDKIQKQAKKEARAAAKAAWQAFNAPIKEELQKLLDLSAELLTQSQEQQRLEALRQELENTINPLLRDVVRIGRNMLRVLRHEQHAAKEALKDWLQSSIAKGKKLYTTHLYSATPNAAVNIPEVKAEYSNDAPLKNGYQILNTRFDQFLEKRPEVFAFGEDVGKIGDVNQGFAGLQEKHGESRVFDTGIREWTIMGQAIGMAMRGLRPIAEIQYLDYLIYGISPLSDDLATLRYRSNGMQAAPAIIRTRGHRLEGIWHSGSPIGMLLGSLRGICVLVPRNMVQAAGFYNTMLQSDDPALIIECLNGYRLKERMPDNLDSFTVPVGVPEVLREGTDVTLVTYGSCVRVAEEAIEQLEEEGISVELIDVQSLLPFDLPHRIGASLAKTNRLVCLDEDVPGGATAFMLEKILTEQSGYFQLDSEPILISAESNRPPYGSEGDYFVKPQAEDIFEKIYGLMHEAKPQDFPALY